MATWACGKSLAAGANPANVRIPPIADIASSSAISTLCRLAPDCRCDASFPDPNWPEDDPGRPNRFTEE
jgi:hypothetical protein